MNPDDPCQCSQDGLCLRFKREMRGRLRSICRGNGVTPEVAAQYRRLWASQVDLPPGGGMLDCPHRGEELRDSQGKLRTRECQGCKGKVRLKLFPCGHPAREPEEVTLGDCRTCAWRPVPKPGARWLILRNHLSPGDVLVMTAAIHSLHRQHPGQFATAVDTTCAPLWEHNPDVVSLDEARQHEATVLQTGYPLIDQSNQRSVHFMQGYCDFLEAALGVRVPLLTNRPMLYLSRREKSWINQVEEVTGDKEPFWVINAGRKNDFTAKYWGSENYQRLVDLLAGKVRFVQVGAREHHHPRLRGVVDLVARTDSRQLVRLCYHAQGAVGGTTLLQHLAAAFDRPYFCLMGGREPVAWNSYPRQQLFHTIGMLSCCRTGGCWKSRVAPLGDGDKKDESLCLSPQGDGEKVPQCLAMITPEEVAASMLKFVP